MENRVCLGLELVKSQDIKTDSQGNWILWAEASNENLDFQGQIVLQQALKKSEQYFLKNGVISYDHRHLHADPEDPHWDPEKYIIGEPTAVKTKGNRTFVQFKLYKSSPVAQRIMKKIQDGSTRVKTSIAGKMPQIVREYSQKLGQAIEVVKGVLWDELAITFKPVNQTLAPITSEQLVKSLAPTLSATPMSPDSAVRTGGSALIGQGVTKRRKKKKTQCRTAPKKNDEGEEIMDAAMLTKAVDDSIADLQKALGAGRRKPKAPTGAPPENEDNLDEEDAYDDDLDDEEDSDGEGDDGNGEGEELDEEPPTVPKKGRRIKKSLEDIVRQNGAGDALDVSEFLLTLTKSISQALEGLQNDVATQGMVQKSLAKAVLAQAQLTKSIGNTPAPRVGVVSTNPRNFTSGQPQGLGVLPDGVTPQFLLQKALDGVKAGKVESKDYTLLQMRLNKGIMPEAHVVDFLKSL